jgi:small subunit ribosomal protein S8
MSDTIADLLTRIRNAQSARKDTVVVPYSKLKLQICEKLVQYNFLASVKVVKGESFDNLEVALDTERFSPVSLKRVSKPGQRIYKKAKELKTVKNGLGLLVLSTPKGVLTNFEAKAQNVGGEVLCLIY